MPTRSHCQAIVNTRPLEPDTSEGHTSDASEARAARHPDAARREGVAPHIDGVASDSRQARHFELTTVDEERSLRKFSTPRCMRESVRGSRMVVSTVSRARKCE